MYAKLLYYQYIHTKMDKCLDEPSKQFHIATTLWACKYKIM